MARLKACPFKADFAHPAMKHDAEGPVLRYSSTARECVGNGAFESESAKLLDPVGYSKDLGETHGLQLCWCSHRTLARFTRKFARLRDFASSRDRVVIGLGQGDEIVCAYHGWRYCGSGACNVCAAASGPAPCAAKAKATAYECCEAMAWFGWQWKASETTSRSFRVRTGALASGPYRPV